MPSIVWREQESLARHTAWRVGGSCDVFVVVHRRKALGGVMRRLREQGLGSSFLGAGTRTVVRDAGVTGAVLRLGLDFAGISVGEDLVEVGAATLCPVVARATGLARLSRMPGSFGAALVCDDHVDWGAFVQEVEVVERNKPRWIPWDDFEAKRDKRWVLGARLVPPQEPELPLRGAFEPSPWFHPLRKRKLDRLITALRLPGTRLRGVAIPPSSPSTFVNQGGGSARDLDLLQRSVVDRAKRERALTLEPRVRWIGRNR